MRAGAARVDITPAIGAMDRAGFSSLAVTPEAAFGRLFATILWLIDDFGQGVAFVAADLHAGTRPVLEKAAWIAGLPPDRLFLSGTHTHSGPGHIYDNRLYDTMGSPAREGRKSVLDARLADQLGEAVGLGIRQAMAEARGATVGLGTSVRWGNNRARSFAATLRAFGGDGRTVDPAAVGRFMNGAPGWPGWKQVVTSKQAGTDETGIEPDAEAATRFGVDPRLRLLWARGTDGGDIGAFGVYGAHGVCFGPRDGVVSADWFGVAERVALLELAKAEPALSLGLPVGLAAGSIGDADPVAVRAGKSGLADIEDDGPHRPRDDVRGEAYARAFGAALGGALAEAARDARRKLLAGATVYVRHSDRQAAGSTVAVDGAVRTLAPKARLGVVSAGGSEMGQTPVLPLLFPEGLRREIAVERSDPQWPKLTLEPLGPLIIPAMKGPPERLPLRLVRVGPWWFVGLPGEPTSLFAARVAERVAGKAWPRPQAVVVAAVTGEYCGYFTTREEYEAQHYEGSSTIWGRWTEAWVLRRVEDLVTAVVAPPRDRERLAAATRSPRLRTAGDRRFTARCADLLLTATWSAPKGLDPPLGPAPWLRIEATDGTPVRIGGVPLDDHFLQFTIHRDRAGALWTWRASCRLPVEVAARLAGRALRLRLVAPQFVAPPGEVSAVWTLG